MNWQKTTIGSLAILALGALGTVAALWQGVGSSVLLSRFALLALSPYAVFCGVCFLADSSRGRAIATFVVCALATAFALYLFGKLIFLDPGSMSGLVFVVAPIFQLPAAILLLIVVFFTRPRSAHTSPLP